MSPHSTSRAGEGTTSLGWWGKVGASDSRREESRVTRRREEPRVTRGGGGEQPHMT